MAKRVAVLEASARRLQEEMAVPSKPEAPALPLRPNGVTGMTPDRRRAALAGTAAALVTAAAQEQPAAQAVADASPAPSVSMEGRRAVLAASSRHLRKEATNAKQVADAAAADRRFLSDRATDERCAALSAPAARLARERLPSTRGCVQKISVRLASKL